jgi:topoisomerase-4 subunit B
MEVFLATYTEDHVKSLDWKDHIRLRPGMYIGKLGDGAMPDDGIYVLVKEILDNSIDEHMMGFGKKIEVEINDHAVKVRDFGRGIPLGKVVDCVSKINTGAKYDSDAFKKSVGLNGVGTKAVNALSEWFKVSSFREGKVKSAEFCRGELTNDARLKASTELDGTLIEFHPDAGIFKNYRYRPAFLDELLWNYAYLNTGLTVVCNGKEYVSKNGLLDLLTKKTEGFELYYPIQHFKNKEIEIALSHCEQSSEVYFSFVNGQHTTMGGTHQQAFRDSLVKTVRDFFKKDFEVSDIRSGLVAAICVRIQEPVFESQTKTKLGSQSVTEDGQSIKTWVHDYFGHQFDLKLHKDKAVADAVLRRIKEAEKEREELAGIKKLARERNKKANLFNKKLRDCRVHLNTNHKLSKESMIFITEGDSASGSITKARNPELQAVFSLRGKPLNCFGMKKKIVYENEELNLLQHALNLEDGPEGLRYNKIIISTDADVDGMHIRLLLLTFFLQFFPEIVSSGHLYVLETPLFRVRDKKQTFYCYSEHEKEKAIAKLGGAPEITRFKGLGEISPDEFEAFIGNKMRVEEVHFIGDESDLHKTLTFYMGKNTPERQDFIVSNLRVESNDITV